MNAIDKISASDRYERTIETSKRVRWDIEKDVIRGRHFDATHKFLPDGLSRVDEFTTLSAGEKRFVSQIQGRTYANIFGLVERFINAKVLELSHDHWFGDQVALEALVRPVVCNPWINRGVTGNPVTGKRGRISDKEKIPVPAYEFFNCWKG